MGSKKSQENFRIEHLRRPASSNPAASDGGRICAEIKLRRAVSEWRFTPA
jgi:hypothetical protein